MQSVNLGIGGNETKKKSANCTIELLWCLSPSYQCKIAGNLNCHINQLIPGAKGPLDLVLHYTGWTSQRPHENQSSQFVDYTDQSSYRSKSPCRIFHPLFATRKCQGGLGTTVQSSEQIPTGCGTWSWNMGEVCCWKRGFKNISRVEHIECGTLVRDLRCCYICFSNIYINSILSWQDHTPVIANMSWDSKCCQDWTGAFQQRNWKVAQVANLSSGTRKTAMMVKVPSWFRLLVGVAHVYAFLLLPPSCHHKDFHAKALSLYTLDSLNTLLAAIRNTNGWTISNNHLPTIN